MEITRNCVRKYVPLVMISCSLEPERCDAARTPKTSNLKKDGIIKANKEFRLIAQSLTAAKKEEINFENLKEGLIKFFTQPEYTPERVYHETAEEHYQFKSIKKSSESFLQQLRLFDFESLDNSKKNEVRSLLQEIIEIINRTW